MACNSFQNREFEASLEEYTTQLQQVETALVQAPDNEELVKLKSDLEQLIGITQVLGGQGEEGNTQSSEAEKQAAVQKNWNKGDRCLATWSQDGMYYPAVIIDLTSGDGKCTVKFETYSATERVNISKLRPNNFEPGAYKSRYEKSILSDHLKRKRPGEMKEYKKNKALKKEQKFKERDEASAKELRKWQDFRSKTSKGKILSAKKKSSIFSVPDAIDGKVGVGTCNIGGKPMTAYEYPKTHKY